MKVFESIVDVVNEIKPKVELDTLDSKSHPANTHVLAGTFEKSIGEILIVEWSASKEYAKIKDIRLEETIWVHREQVYVHEVIVEHLASLNDSDINRGYDVDSATIDNWGEQFGGQVYGFSTPAGVLSGIGVSDVHVPINYPEGPFDLTPPDISDNLIDGSFIETKETLGNRQEIKGIFHSISDEEITLEVDSNNEVIAIKDNSENPINVEGKHSIILGEDGYIHLVGEDINPPPSSFSNKDTMKNQFDVDKVVEVYRKDPDKFRKEGEDGIPIVDLGDIVDSLRKESEQSDDSQSTFDLDKDFDNE